MNIMISQRIMQELGHRSVFLHIHHLSRKEERKEVGISLMTSGLGFEDQVESMLACLVSLCPEGLGRPFSLYSNALIVTRMTSRSQPGKQKCRKEAQDAPANAGDPPRQTPWISSESSLFPLDTRISTDQGNSPAVLNYWCRTRRWSQELSQDVAGGKSMKQSDRMPLSFRAPVPRGCRLWNRRPSASLASRQASASLASRQEADSVETGTRSCN